MPKTRVQLAKKYMVNLGLVYHLTEIAKICVFFFLGLSLDASPQGSGGYTSILVISVISPYFLDLSRTSKIIQNKL